VRVLESDLSSFGDDRFNMGVHLTCPWLDEASSFGPTMDGGWGTIEVARKPADGCPLNIRLDSFLIHDLGDGLRIEGSTSFVNSGWCTVSAATDMDTLVSTICSRCLGEKGLLLLESITDISIISDELIGRDKISHMNHREKAALFAAVGRKEEAMVEAKAWLGQFREPAFQRAVRALLSKWGLAI
jgi:hypothetical protein